MKRIAFLCLFLSSLQVYADTVITESIESHGRNMTVAMKIKGSKIRMDVNPQMSTVMDTSTGDTLTILHTQKKYMVIPGEKSKAMMDQIKSIAPNKTATETSAEKPKLTDTGKAEKVGSFNTEVYTVDTSTSHVTMWLAKDVPNYVALLEQMKKLRTMGNAGAAATPMTDTELQGYPVKMEIVSKGQTTTITVLSLDEKPVDEAEMAAPAGYTEISMPGAGGRGAGQPQP